MSFENHRRQRRSKYRSRPTAEANGSGKAAEDHDAETVASDSESSSASTYRRRGRHCAPQGRHCAPPHSQYAYYNQNYLPGVAFGPPPNVVYPRSWADYPWPPWVDQYYMSRLYNGRCMRAPCASVCAPPCGPPSCAVPACYSTCNF